VDITTVIRPGNIQAASWEGTEQLLEYKNKLFDILAAIEKTIDKGEIFLERTIGNDLFFRLIAEGNVKKD
jgi:hypothetical protein